MWNDIKRELWQDGFPPCFVCGAPATELHHGLLSRSKRFKKYVDVPQNAATACHNCNVVTRKADTYAAKESLLRAKIAELGYDFLRSWLDDFPDKAKLGREWKELDQMLTPS